MACLVVLFEDGVFSPILERRFGVTGLSECVEFWMARSDWPNPEDGSWKSYDPPRPFGPTRLILDPGRILLLITGLGWGWEPEK